MFIPYFYEGNQSTSKMSDYSRADSKLELAILQRARRQRMNTNEFLDLLLTVQKSKTPREFIARSGSMEVES